MIALAILRLRNLLAVVMLSGIYSLLAAGLFVTMDAVDVAFTEAAVGGGIATVLLLATLALTSDEEKPPETKLPILPPARRPGNRRGDDRNRPEEALVSLHPSGAP